MTSFGPLFLRRKTIFRDRDIHNAMLIPQFLYCKMRQYIFYQTWYRNTEIDLSDRKILLCTYLKHSGENLISFRDYFLLRHHAAVYVLCNRDLIISKISTYLRKILNFVRSRYQNNPSYSLFCLDHAIVIYCHRGYREYSMVSFNIIRVVYIQIICLFSIRILSTILFVI